MTPVEQKWYEDVATFSPEALQVLLEAYEAQIAAMTTKIAYVQLLIALDSCPPEPLPMREKPTTLPIGFKFDVAQWRDELAKSRVKTELPPPTEGGSTWIAKTK